MNNEHCKGRLLEPEIKAMVLNHLKNNGRLTQNTSIINEFTVDNFSRRVDLAIIDKKHFIAYEIKSEADSLYRLNGQTEKYLEYFDKVVIVAAPKHINKILDTVPQNVAVWEITSKQIKVKQRGKFISIRDKRKQIDLMKVNELLKLSNKLGLPYKSKNRHSLGKELQGVSIKTLREAALDYIRVRFEMTSSLFLSSIDGSQARPKDIELLSLYREERKYIKAKKEEKDLLWNNWGLAFNEDLNLITMSQEKSEPLFGGIPKNIQALMAA